MHNEADNIGELVQILVNDVSIDNVIVVDSPLSNDNAKTVLASLETVEYLVADQPGRANQMNFGAKYASNSDVFCFVHADVIPCANFGISLLQAIENGADAGCFSYCFDQKSFWLQLNARATKIHNIFTGGGDQAIFIKKSVFQSLNGFDEDHVIMEDFDLVRRCKAARYRFDLIKNDLIVSARKYENNSYLKVNLVNAFSFLMFYMNVSPKRIQSFYQYWIN